ncbi:EAL domain-containing protein [uncultured Lamprocystis sp.]|jgi:diguanylate cyclase (GGDEF)-like protein/PAS domain S-box-containing protein|uniref:putative bifunctional diguanylate cyclase/phosphodiesterase n=1 Tax=uncultured Lamprocystis sp. TaxID=543132 RepID=UPI0025D3EC48|nr:EAL domain-containing protein [uncultured Lamprocystis sp.]
MAELKADPTPWGGRPSRKDNEARFQKLFEEADAMSIQGYLPDGTLVYWNRASERIYGYTAAEALGANLLDLIIPPEMHTQTTAAVRWMFETGKGIPPSRMALKHKDGRRVPVYSSHTIVAVPGQSPVMFCMDADMSALHQAEAELRVAAAAFDSQQGMLITDAAGVILRVNAAFTRATGYAATEAVGQTPRLIHSGRQSPEFYRALWHDLRTAGFWQGEIWNQRKNGEVYADWVTIAAVKDEWGRVTNYVGTQTDMTHRKNAEAKITRLAYFDPLTQLPNRRQMLDRLQRSVAANLRNRSAGALLFIDVDDFQTLNDTLGHDQGDLLLQQIAQRLKRIVRAGDTAARLGGDEFVVLLDDLSPNLTEAADAVKTVGDTILTSLSQVYHLREQEYLGSVSLGVTLFSHQESSVDELLKQADLALFEAKAAGRNTLRFFDLEMQAAITRRATLLNGLREGLRQQQFRLFLQPQVNRDGALVGAEALIRWHCPVRGLVSPADFIPVAEESGLILPLGKWVLDAACALLATWGARPETAHLTLAVNVSARQFRQTDFVDQVLTTLDRYQANPRRLKLELTESLLVDRLDEVIVKMSALKTLGLGLALDDFGTGYSSLSYLRHLPLEQLKIDRSFVRDLPADRDSAAVAQTIIVLGQTMGLCVLAEGVETQAQRDLLASLGCHGFQGYFFGEPMPMDAFQELIRPCSQNEPTSLAC